MIRHALAYAQHRCAVFPLSQQTRAPLTKHGLRDATTDPGQVAAWWRKWPEALIGVRCDWFFVVDVDPRNGGDVEWIAMCQANGGVPHTWEALTGRYGQHLFFAHDPRLDAIPLGKWTDGIDIKGGGRGYIVAPPSVHPVTGRKYEWVVKPRDCRLAKAPKWLVSRIVRDKTPPPSPPPVDTSQYEGLDKFERARKYIRQCEPAISGSGGHSKTFWVAQRVAVGFALSDDEAFALLSEWNQDCQPPWSERELRRKISEARRCGSLQEGSLLR